MPFSSLHHQPLVTEQLIRTLQLGRLAHAYLFAGERGAGKFDTAIALAQAVNCPEFSTLGDACGQCESCRKFAALNHPDLFAVRPESKSRQIKIEQIQALNKAVFQKPMMARVKVVIIEDADCMNPPAYNAFLKTLEEPPLNCLMMLLTTLPEAIPDTIVARCQKIRFADSGRQPLTPLEEKTLDFLATRSAEQNLFDLYTGLTALLAELDTDVKTEKKRLEDSLGHDKWKDIADKSYFERVEEETEAKLSAFRRRERQGILRVLYLWHRDLLALSATGGAIPLNFPARQEALMTQAAASGAGKLLQSLAIIENLIDELDKTNLPEMLAFENVFLKLQAK
ncbi:DNA polymerase III subunit delta' [Oscillatoria laete-virens NRMC-F 0139]|nr:DNA polymerase III subunit delta' [Oscillatoria laete-virens]MDL5053604.1 DNA polymerase III subunit delta' [Oscillatoria laete-virens NRMC-F 0139]